RIFDLDTPGHGEYSMMNVFARWVDVWTMDHENYGKSGRTGGNSDIASGAQDLMAMQVVTRETGQSKAHFMGESSGALRAGLYAMTEPDGVDRLVLAAFTHKGTDSPTLKKRTARTFPFTQYATARQRHDREHLHARQSRHDRSGRGENPCRCLIAVRRSGADRDIPRHDRQSPRRRPEESSPASPARARRL